VSGYCDSS
jgi:hypothetical protein